MDGLHPLQTRIKGTVLTCKEKYGKKMSKLAYFVNLCVCSIADVHDIKLRPIGSCLFDVLEQMTEVEDSLYMSSNHEEIRGGEWD